MIAWPANLPEPMRDSINIYPGDTAVRRKLQSGRTEVRRFGAPAFDTVNCTFRIHNTDVPAFRYFFDHTSNMGINWFTADWLANLGYTSHCARIRGYIRPVNQGSFYTDFGVTLLVADTTWHGAETEWPSAGPGAPGNPPLPDGPVRTWGYFIMDSTFAPPANQRATCLISGFEQYWQDNSNRPYWYCAVNPDGTLSVWGTTAGIALLPGWDSVGGIYKVASGGHNLGLYYLTTAGAIGHLGNPTAGTTYPGGVGYVDIMCTRHCGIAVNAAGGFEYWGTSQNTALTDAEYNGVSNSIRSNGAPLFATFVENGVARIFATTTGVLQSTGYNPASNTNIACAHALNSTYRAFAKNDGSWEFFGMTTAVTANIPAGLLATECRICSASLMMARHGTTGSLVVWGTDYTDIKNDAPPGISVLPGSIDINHYYDGTVRMRAACIEDDG